MLCIQPARFGFGTPFILPVPAKRNFLVMREISVVISWTMRLGEALPQYPIEALLADCDTHNSKLLSRKQLGRKEEELPAHMILGPFFQPQ